MSSTSPPPSNEVHATLAGPIDQGMVQRVFNACTTMMSNRITHAHVLFHSTGGYVGDGVALYNYFRTLPFDLTLYNAGYVSSIAAISFLGAKHRKTSAYASFMIHSSSISPQSASAAKLKSVTEGLLIDDARTEAILRSHLTMTEDQWRHLGYHDLTFSGADAVTIGLADEVAEFAPPAGQQIFNF